MRQAPITHGIWRVLIVLAVTLYLAGTAHAHFQLNLNVRVFHVAHTADGLDIYLRTPMPYVLAQRVGPEGDDGLPTPAPFTVNRLEDGAVMHVIAPAALRADPKGLGLLAAQDLVVETGSVRPPLTVFNVRVHPVGSEPGFATLAEAADALSGGGVFPDRAGETFVGDAIVDVHLKLKTGAPVGPYALSSVAEPDLPGQHDTANLILDYDGETVRTYRARGLMNEPIIVSGSVAAAASTFIVAGIRHILEGLDHVLFVLCIVIGAATLRSLLARVTGFTIGHTVTLILGFFGFVPQGAWFIPAVETAIALSIIYAALDAVFRQEHSQADEWRSFAVTSAIGLLHGFGFSFMLHNILKVDAPNVWQSLLAFNLGVEVGQLMIVAALWPLVLLLRGRPAFIWRAASGSVAIAASLVAAVWVVERSSVLVSLSLSAGPA